MSDPEKREKMSQLTVKDNLAVPVIRGSIDQIAKILAVEPMAIQELRQELRDKANTKRVIEFFKRCMMDRGNVIFQGIDDNGIDDDLIEQAFVGYVSNEFREDKGLKEVESNVKQISRIMFLSTKKGMEFIGKSDFELAVKVDDFQKRIIEFGKLLSGKGAIKYE